MRARRIVGIKQDWRRNKTNMKQNNHQTSESQTMDTNSQVEELQAFKKQSQGRENELSNVQDESRSSILYMSPAPASWKIDTYLVSEELGTENAEDLEKNIEEDVQEDLGTKIEEAPGEASASHDFRNELDTNPTKMTEDESKGSGTENDPPTKTKSGDDVHDNNADQKDSRHSWTNDVANQNADIEKSVHTPGKKVTRQASSPELIFTAHITEPVLNEPQTGLRERTTSLTRIEELKETETCNGVPRQPRMLTRRSSSPNLMFTATQAGETVESKLKTLLKSSLTSVEESKETKMENEVPRKPRMMTRRRSSPNLMFTAMQAGENKSKTVLESSVEELSQKNSLENFSPFDIPAMPKSRTTRRKSVAVMTGVSNPFQPGPPDLNTLGRSGRSLPELNESFEGFNGVERNNFKRRASIQSNQVHESLRKISRRLTTALTGAELEKRLKTHHVDSAVLQTRETSMPETKVPNQLDMSDLEECRYIRKRVSR